MGMIFVWGFEREAVTNHLVLFLLSLAVTVLTIE
jgi:hypothetical protein